MTYAQIKITPTTPTLDITSQVSRALIRGEPVRLGRWRACPPRVNCDPFAIDWIRGDSTESRQGRGEWEPIWTAKSPTYAAETLVFSWMGDWS